MKISLADDTHGDLIGTFDSFEEVIAEVRRIADIPWDQEPNCPPCTSWQTCSRSYCITGYDEKADPPLATESVFVLEIGSKGVRWWDRIRERWDEAVAAARNPPPPNPRAEPRILITPPPPHPDQR